MKQIIFFFHFLLLTTSLYGGLVSEGLRQIPERDIILMKEFVKLNFKWNQAAHVIFFHNKPSCLATAFIKSPDKDFQNLLWVRGWETFKKHEHLFPHPNFLFMSHLWDEDEDGYQSLSLFILNKRALMKCFNSCKTIFQAVIGEHFCYEWFIAELEKGKNIEEIIKNDQVLLGILLGYGKESAKTFNDHQAKRLQHFFLREEIYCGNSPEAPDKCDCFPVAFMGNPRSKEVQNILSEYKRELEIFWNMYQKKNPLVLFLEGICENDSDVLQSTFKTQKKLASEFAFYVMLNPFSVDY